jgi:hypothetical protein
MRRWLLPAAKRTTLNPPSFVDLPQMAENETPRRMDATMH